VDANGTSISNTAVTVAGGGVWNLTLAVSDPENTGTSANRVRIKVRRKLAATASDFPTTADAVYRTGFNDPGLFNVPNTNDLTQQAGMISATSSNL
jgi:hypothetical protein